MSGPGGTPAGLRTARVRLTFPEHLITQPVLARMMRLHDVEPNIRRAKVEETVGWIVCELAGAADAVDAAIAWLRQQGVEVDHLGDVVEG
ncbi:MAG TPA: NIL domain-containing protein [Acidimicrobiales bacterium]|nr:NIL domain-containing protein [Acidimicrobiales bacterium]